MTVYRLNREPVFPPADAADPEGLLAIGGDLTVPRLLAAYRSGIFPWYSDDQPILWWSPDPRMVLPFDEFHCSRRLERVIRQGKFTFTLDRDFTSVILACATAPRPGQDGTWITHEMIDAYVALHEAGYAHSAEAWLDGKLAGGVYGVSLGSCFFGESMFARESDASKAAFTVLVRQLRAWHFTLLDCQMYTEHLARFGAHEIPRGSFLRRLAEGLRRPTRKGPWSFDTME
jgi:leucyl/phenylalanyl-tRNA--protein transferase